jgi:hypothetical protein
MNYEPIQKDASSSSKKELAFAVSCNGFSL